MQVCDHLAAIAKPLSISVVTIVGGMSVAKQTRQIASKPEIIVATPGRFWELVAAGKHSFLNR